MEIESKIISIDRKTRRISLSVKALEIEAEGQAIQDYGSTTTLSTNTFGDKLREKLSMQDENREPDEAE